ncbi:hypothetical protein ACIA5C_19480 [Actinoplanes sp. NPDC051343]|uniref:hypothetical protein n=1 Tax=Actinoplanes sp. NPDC051343 TaxID=3363906 RepID=UPI0037A89B39
MLPEVAKSRIAILRYRTRLFMARLLFGRPRTLDLVNLILAIIGAWSVIYQILKFFIPKGTGGAGIATAGFAALLIAAALTWLRLTRRPQDLFRSASTSEDKAESLRKIMLDGMTNDAAYENLASLYSPIIELAAQQMPGIRVDCPLDIHGKRTLVLTIAAPAQQTLDSLINELGPEQDLSWKSRVSKFAPERQSFMATLRRSVFFANRFGDEGGSNLVLVGTSATPDLKMSVRTATYGQIVRTSDSLVNEFAIFANYIQYSAFRRRSRPLQIHANDILKVLPWRRTVHSWEDPKDLLLAPQSRAAGLGVSLSLIDQLEGDATVFVARRSSSVGTYPDVLHVVPSGMMNVHGDIRHVPSALSGLPRLSMLAEFLEECLDIAEFSGHSAVNFAERVADKLDELRLNDLDPTFTGLAIDLLNLRTDVCGVLDLSGRYSLLNRFNLSWEYTHTERLHRVGIASLPISLSRTDFVQSGIGSAYLAAMWLAAYRADKAGS